MTFEERQDAQQIELAELRLRIKSLTENTKILEQITRELLTQVVKDRREAEEFKQEHELILATLQTYTAETGLLRQAFGFRTPEKLEAALIKSCEDLSMEDHLELIRKIRNGETITISKPKKKKASK